MKNTHNDIEISKKVKMIIVVDKWLNRFGLKGLVNQMILPEIFPVREVGTINQKGK